MRTGASDSYSGLVAWLLRRVCAIATGAVMMSVGIPWAFYVKPWLVRRQKKKLQERVARGEIKPRPRPTIAGNGKVGASLNESAAVGSAQHD